MNKQKDNTVSLPEFPFLYACISFLNFPSLFLLNLPNYLVNCTQWYQEHNNWYQSQFESQVTTAMASIESQLEGMNALLRQILDGVHGVKSEITEVRSAVDAVMERVEVLESRYETTPSVGTSAQIATAATSSPALISAPDLAFQDPPQLQAEEMAAPTLNKPAATTTTLPLPNEQRLQQLARAFNLGADILNDKFLMPPPPQVFPATYNRRRDLQVGPRRPEILRREAVLVVVLPHEVGPHGGAALVLRRYHERGRAEREAVAAVHLPGAPELAEHAGHVVQLRLRQHPQHVRVRPQPRLDLVRVRVPQPLLLRRQRVEDFPRDDVHQVVDELPERIALPASQDACGFAVWPQHLQRYREHANIYKEEEVERSERWKSFLDRQDEDDASSGEDATVAPFREDEVAADENAEVGLHPVNTEESKPSEDSDDEFYDVEKVDPSQEVPVADSANADPGIKGGASQKGYYLWKEELECLVRDELSKAPAMFDVEGNRLESLYKVLSFSLSLELKKDSAHLCYILFENATLRASPIATECLQPLISLVTSGSSVVVEPAVRVLNRLLDGEYNAEVAATSEVVDLLVSFVPGTNYQLSEACIGALIKLEMVEPLFLLLCRPDVTRWDQHSILQALVNILMDTDGEGFVFGVTAFLPLMTSTTAFLSSKLGPEVVPTLEEGGAARDVAENAEVGLLHEKIAQLPHKNFFAGPLLLLMSEEKVFWTLVGVIDDYFEGVIAGGTASVGVETALYPIDKVGPDGVLSIASSSSVETTVEVEEGMGIDHGYISPQFVTNLEKSIVELENAKVPITDQKVTSIKEIFPILAKTIELRVSLFIIVEDNTGEALATLVINKLRGILNVAAIKAPSFGERRKSVFQDIVIVTGAEYIAKDLGLWVENASLEQLGTAGKVTIHQTTTTLIADAASKDEIQARVAQPKKELAETASVYDSEKLSERIAIIWGNHSFSSGLGTSRI